MKKVSKAILIALAILVAVGVALVACLNLYIQSPGAQARIQEELSKSLRLPLKLTNVTVSPFGKLSITGITIPNGGANFLDAASFHARYRWLPLLQGKFVITEMSVDGPKVVWTQGPDGNWKLPEPAQAENAAGREADQKLLNDQKKGEAAGGHVDEKSPAAAAPEKKGSFAVVVERFYVNGGSLELLDQSGHHVAVLSDVNIVYTSLTEDRVEGTATIGQAIWADTVTVEKLTTPFKMADGALDLSSIAGTLAGGTLTGRFHTHKEKDRAPYKVAVTLAKVDLDPLTVQMGSAPGQSTGTLSGQIEIHGDNDHPDRRDGEGHLDVRDAQFHQLDLFLTIGQLLGLRDLRVTDGHVDLRLDGEKVLVDKLALQTADLQLAAHGSARLDKRLKMDAQLSVDEAMWQRLPSIIRDSFVPGDAGRHALNFAISGSLDKPRTNLVDKLVGQKVNAQFGDLLGSLFGEKKPEDDRARKEKERKKKDRDKQPAAPAADLTGVAPPPPATPQPSPPNP